MRALYFETFGSSEVLQYGEISRPTIQENEVLVKVEYAGLNFADIYRRRGTYLLNSIIHTSMVMKVQVLL